MPGPDPLAGLGWPQPPLGGLGCGTLEVLLWALSLARLDRDADLAERLHRALSATDSAELQAVTAPARRLELLGGRGMLRLMLAALAPFTALREAPLQRGLHGQPLLGAAQAPHFSISHGGGVVLLALAPGLQVGCDIERHDRPLPVQRLARRVLDEVEQAHLRALPAPAQHLAFMQAWVGKEAVLKAAGSGVAGIPARVRVLTTTRCPRQQTSAGAAMRWHALWPALPEPLLACIACEQPPAALRCFELH